MTGLLLAALLGQAGPPPERPPAPPRQAQEAQGRASQPPPDQPPAQPPDRPPPRPALSPQDEEVVRHLELLERLDFLRHAHVVDDGEVSEPRKPSGR